MQIRTRGWTAAVAMLIGMAGGDLAQASELKLYLSQPGMGPGGSTVPASAIPWADQVTYGAYTMETFDALDVGVPAAAGAWAVGSYAASGNSTIQPANIWGGANGSGNYLNPGSGVTVTLSAPARYVGFWWSAGDGPNSMQVLDENDNVLVSMTAADVVSFLNSAATFTSVDNSATYAKADYFGNPFEPFKQNGQTTPWPYAYLNFVLSDTTGASSTTIRKLRFTGGSFELDNVAVREQAPTGIPGPWVDTGTTYEFTDPPLTRNDTFTATKDKPSGPLNLLSNDPYVPPGATVTVPSSTSGGGTVTAGPGADQWTYTPPAGFTGTDTFTYTVCLPSPDDGKCSTSTVTVSVSAAPAVAAVPTLTEWGLLLMTSALGWLAWRRRPRS